MYTRSCSDTTRHGSSSSSSIIILRAAIKRRVAERPQDARWSNHWRWDAWRASREPAANRVLHATVTRCRLLSSDARHEWNSRKNRAESGGHEWFDRSAGSMPRINRERTPTRTHRRRIWLFSSSSTSRAARRRRYMPCQRLPPTTRSITKNSKTQTLGVFAAQVPPLRFSLSLLLSNVADGRCES